MNKYSIQVDWYGTWEFEYPDILTDEQLAVMKHNLEVAYYHFSRNVLEKKED